MCLDKVFAAWTNELLFSLGLLVFLGDWPPSTVTSEASSLLCSIKKSYKVNIKIVIPGSPWRGGVKF